MKRASSIIALALGVSSVAMLSGCYGTTVVIGDFDAGAPRDTGVRDGGSRDAALREAATTPDATSPRDSDTPRLDVGRPDASTPELDATPGFDVGPIGESDAGTRDAAPDPCMQSCAAGQLCCPLGAVSRCENAPMGVCPLPDLTVSAERATSSSFVEWRFFEANDCAIVEGCVEAPGWRRLLRFDTFTPNVGTADFVMGEPSAHPDLFEFSSCHGHYHFNGYAEYGLYDASGMQVARGHKQAFCLLDSERFSADASPLARYSCSDQGIQRGWGDVYTAGLDCQWVDVTDVPQGDYSLQIAINNERTIPELSYDNNVVRVPVRIEMSNQVDPLAPCVGAQGGAARRDCGWRLDTPGTCRPGSTVRIGCGANCGLGQCTGDPMLRVCGGHGACTSASSLLSVDDSSCARVCPYGTFVCPPTGTFTIMTTSFQSQGAPYTCNVAYDDGSDAGVPDAGVMGANDAAIEPDPGLDAGFAP